MVEKVKVTIASESGSSLRRRSREGVMVVVESDRRAERASPLLLVAFVALLMLSLFVQESSGTYYTGELVEEVVTNADSGEGSFRAAWNKVLVSNDSYHIRITRSCIEINLTTIDDEINNSIFKPLNTDSRKTIYVSGNGVTFRSLVGARAFTIFSGKVTFSECTFTGFNVCSSGEGTPETCSGGVIRSVHSEISPMPSLLIISCTFMNNQIGSLETNSAVFHGSVISLEHQSFAVIYISTLANNIGGDSTVYIAGESVIDIRYSTIVDNVNGGVMAVDDVTIGLDSSILVRNSRPSQLDVFDLKIGDNVIFKDTGFSVLGTYDSPYSLDPSNQQLPKENPNYVVYPIAPNGGKTWTCALDKYSIAYNKGRDIVGISFIYSQTDTLRLCFNRTDAGAFELCPQPPPFNCQAPISRSPSVTPTRSIFRPSNSPQIPKTSSKTTSPESTSTPKESVWSSPALSPSSGDKVQPSKFHFDEKNVDNEVTLDVNLKSEKDVVARFIFPPRSVAPGCTITIKSPREDVSKSSSYKDDDCTEVSQLSTTVDISITGCKDRKLNQTVTVEFIGEQRDGDSCIGFTSSNKNIDAKWECLPVTNAKKLNGSSSALYIAETTHFTSFGVLLLGANNGCTNQSYWILAICFLGGALIIIVLCVLLFVYWSRFRHVVRGHLDDSELFTGLQQQMETNLVDQ